jgi:hypothetical protein
VKIALNRRAIAIHFHRLVTASHIVIHGLNL